METVTWTRSRLSRSSGKHIWRISDFRLLLTAFSRPENENRIDSPPFKIGANQDEFFLSIQSRKRNGGNIVGLFLYNISGKDLILNLVVYLQRRDENLNQTVKHSASNFFKNRKSWGWEDFFSGDIRPFLFAEDEIAITAEIVIFQNFTLPPISQSGRGQFENDLNLTEQGSLQADLRTALSNIDDTNPDFMVVSGSRRIATHRALLSIRSPIFARMLRSGMREVRNGEVIIDDADPLAVEKFVNFLYTDECEFVEDKKDFGEDMMILAEKYNTIRLKRLAERHFADIISVENAAKILILADMFNCDDLRKIAVDFIKENLENVRETEDFKDILDNKQDLLKLFF